MPEPTLLLLDGNSLINRAFFGLLGRQNLTAPDGTPTGALFAFLNMYLRYLDDIQPTHVVAAFDRKEPTFRHQWFGAYKATRKPMPDELAVQMPILKELLAHLGVNCLETPGYEADDLIGTLSALGQASQMAVTIVTGDKDSFQLAGSGVSVWQPVTRAGRTETEKYDEAAILARYQVTPAQFVDLKAIMGDPSDNIPGVRGIGEKGATELIVRYSSLDGVYAALAEIRPTLAEKLRESREMAYLSQRLATICREAPIKGNLDDFRLKPPNEAALSELLTRLGFRNLLSRLNLSAAAPQADTELTPACTSCSLEIWQQDLLENLPDLPAAWMENGRPLYWADDSRTCCLANEDGQAAWPFLSGKLLRQDKVLRQDAVLRIAVYDFKQMLHMALSPDRWPDLDLPVHDVLIAACLLNQVEGRPDLERLYQRVTGKVLANGSTECIDPSASRKQSPAQNKLPVQEDLFSLEESAAGPASAGNTGLAASAAASLQDQAALARAVREIALTQREQIMTRKIDFLAYEVEMPLAGILAAMEKRGFAIDEAVLGTLSGEMGRRLEILQQEIFQISGHPFNLNSPRQLGDVLFKELGLAPGKKGSGGAFSTDSDELERLAGEHPAVPLIIEHRQTAKLLSTYVEGLKKALDPVDRRVHTTFSQTLTATGRLSSSEPNLQNIPIRTEAGAKIRQAFVAAPGQVLLDADYSQIELRLLAHLSGDPAMIEAFVQAEDIHTNTAVRIFGLPPGQITPDMRSIAKTMNFSIVYGISDFGLARDLGVTVRQAHHYIEEYEQLYPRVRQYLDGLVEAAYRDGYVETLLGRRRYLNELKSVNRNLRQFGERAAMNTPVQGTAADLIKIAMVRTAKGLRKAGMRAGLILQVHDELIVEAPLAEATAAAGILKEAMENALELRVPLLAEVRQGASWAGCKK